MYDVTKETTSFAVWNGLLCRRADWTAQLWPTNRQALYDAGLSVDAAMRQTYPDWSPPK